MGELRWLRWKIFQKLRDRSLCGNDLDKYEELVQEVCRQVQEHSEWEAAVWLNKIETREDVN